MDFIGIGISKEDNFDLIDLKHEAELKYSLYMSSLSENTDPEVLDGLMSFSKELKLIITQFIDKNNPKFNTSTKVNENLVNYFLEKEKNIRFLDFLIEYKMLFPQKFYLICAFDWIEEDNIQLIQIKFSNLYSFFKKNNSWYIRLYDYKRDLLNLLLDYPVVFEIENDAL